MPKLFRSKQKNAELEQLFAKTEVIKKHVFTREGVLAENDAAERARAEKTGKLRSLRIAKEAQENSAAARKSNPRVKRVAS